MNGYKVQSLISSIKQLLGMDTIKVYRNDTSDIEQYWTIYSNKLLNRLHCFLRTRIPLNRLDLLPGQHWVWNSLRSKLPKISSMMILSNHIVECEDLKYRNGDECLLCKINKFISMAVLDNDDNMDGNYLVYYMKRGLYFSSGMAEVGIKRRRKEHVSASMRSNNVQMNNKFYASYPSTNCDPKKLPSEDVKLENYQQLEWQKKILPQSLNYFLGQTLK